MNNSNIIVSIIIVLCLAAGVTAYGLTHDNAIVSGLSGFASSGSSGDTDDNGLGNSSDINHNNDNIGENSNSNGSGTSSNQVASSDSGSSSGSSSGVSSSGSGSNSGSSSSKLSLGGTAHVVDTAKGSNLVGNPSISNYPKPTTSNGTNSSDGWITEEEAIEIVCGDNMENYLFTVKTNNSYIVVFKFYVDEPGQYPMAGWYNDGIEVSKNGTIIGENLMF